MSKGPTVWIANEAGHPYYKVEKLLGEGVEVKPLTLGDINPLKIDRISWHIGRGIGKFVDKEDYLLISGSPTINAIALSMWLAMYGKCQLVLWDAKDGEYILATVEKENLERILQKHLEE